MCEGEKVKKVVAFGRKCKLEIAGIGSFSSRLLPRMHSTAK